MTDDTTQTQNAGGQAAQTQPSTQTKSDYDSLELVGRYIPDDNSGPFNSMAEAVARGHDTLNPTTGVYQIGFLKDGDFVPFYEDAAAHVFEQLANSRKARDAKEQSGPTS